jgi:nucleoside-diphosphate-sugar epimerase
MKIFVTGATGVVGRRVVPLLVQRGHGVTGVSRSPKKSDELARVGAEPLQLNLFDLDKVKAALKGHDIAINLATAIPPSSKALLPWAWRETTRIRRYVSANIAAAARHVGAERVIQESFAPIYVSAGDEWLTEMSPVKPTRYNRSVLDAERAALGFAVSGGKAIVLRFGWFYGPDSDFSTDVITMLRKGWAPVLGSADAYFSSLSHDDAARAVLGVLNAPSGIYNVADDQPVRKRELFESLAQILRVDPPRFPPSWLANIAGPVGKILARSQRISNEKLRSVGWSPKYATALDGWKDVIRSLPGKGAQRKTA